MKFMKLGLKPDAFQVEGNTVRWLMFGEGWSLFQTLLQTLKKLATKHGVSIPTVAAARHILDQPAVAGSMVGVRLGLSNTSKTQTQCFHSFSMRKM